ALLRGAPFLPIIGLPPITTNDPERYVDRILDEVLTTFSRPDTLTTSLQDWRKGRRAEIADVNGYAGDGAGCRKGAGGGARWPEAGAAECSRGRRISGDGAGLGDGYVNAF